MIEYIFFDLDDTLFDFRATEAISLCDTLRHFGIEPNDAIVTRYAVINRSRWELLEIGKLTRDEVKTSRFQILFDELGLSCDPVAVTTYYEGCLARLPIFVDGAKELLDTLYGKYRLYLASNGQLKVQMGRLGSAGILHYFESLFLSEQIGFVKPQKEFFDHAFATIKDFDPTKAIILGDSLTSDIRGGLNAGILTCWFNPHRVAEREDIRPHFTIEDLRTFPALLQNL